MASPSQNRTAPFYHAVEVGPAFAIFASAVATFLAIVVLRFIIEAVVALIAIAENTQRTADNTRR